jgi:hypothetical protein
MWFAAVQNTGQVWELAPQYNALVVFAEHRYYGSSFPFNDAATAFANGTTLQWLTSEQALADFAVPPTPSVALSASSLSSCALITFSCVCLILELLCACTARS